MYSCAVDCFLEVAEHGFLQYFRDIESASISEFCRIMSDACYDYESMLSLYLTTEDLFCIFKSTERLFGPCQGNGVGLSIESMYLHSFLKYCPWKPFVRDDTSRKTNIYYEI